jgi:hypothetical protein
MEAWELYQNGRERVWISKTWSDIGGGISRLAKQMHHRRIIRRVGTKCDYQIAMGGDRGKLFASEIKNDWLLVPLFTIPQHSRLTSEFTKNGISKCADPIKQSFVSAILLVRVFSYSSCYVFTLDSMLSPDANGRYGKHLAGVRRISALTVQPPQPSSFPLSHLWKQLSDEPMVTGLVVKNPFRIKFPVNCTICQDDFWY